MTELAEIRKRHELDTGKPFSRSRANVCHKDRATLLNHIAELQAEIKTKDKTIRKYQTGSSTGDRR